MTRRNTPRKLNGELVWTFSLSFAAHAVLIVLFLAGPNRYLGAATPELESYTVELVAPGALGGNDGPVGPGVSADVGGEAEQERGELEAPPEPAEEIEPPAVVDQPAESAEPEELAEAEPQPEPAEVVAEPEDIEEAAPEVEAEEPAPIVEAKVTEPEPDVAEPESVAVVEEPKPATQPAPTKAKPVAATKPAKATPKPAATARPVATARKVSPPTPSPDPRAERDRRIADAIGRRSQQAKAPSVDDQISAAVQRRAEQMASTGGGRGGPLSVGPGTGGGGGTVIGAEYVLYKRRMEARIRDAWVWAGKDDSLESVVRFAISSDGYIENVRTTRSSGDPAYDASAERAVRAASPLGMVPPTYRAEFADVEMTFRARDLR